MEELQGMTTVRIANLLGYPKNFPERTPSPVGSWQLLYRLIRLQGGFKNTGFKEFLIKVYLRQIVQAKA
jgi:hypothetical protein